MKNAFKKIKLISQNSLKYKIDEKSCNRDEMEDIIKARILKEQRCY